MTADGGECAVRTVLDERAARHGPRTLMRIDGVDVSFVQMRERSIAAANVLRGHGVSPGDTVALFSASTPEWVYFWLGAARIGAISAAVNAANKGDYLRHALAVSAASVVITDTAERAQRVLEVAGELPLLRTVLTDEVPPATDLLDVLSTADELSCASTMESPGTRGFRPDEPAALFFTSGTTGPSKAVVTSWRYLFTAAETVAAAWDFRAGEVIWSAMPLFHLSAVATILAPMLVGGTTVLESAFRPTEVWDGVRGSGAVGFVGAGAMVSMLWKLPPDPSDDASGMRFISAAPIAAEHYRAIEHRYGCRVVTMYGMTEAFPIALKTVDEKGVPGTSGSVNPAFEVAILDADGQPVVDSVGELICRATCPGVMSLGYLDPDTRSVRAHEEWFHTGDLVRLDDDGTLTYVDRVKDAIRRRGENVSSVEVENVITTYPGVTEAAAVGVPSDLGEEDILVVLAVLPGDAVDPHRLLDFCADRMPYFCVPRYVRIVPALPRNVIGRVRKDLLRAEGVGLDAWDREAQGYVVRR